MTTIKGPVYIRGGFNARKFLEEHVKDVKVKLPFTATGWKSTKNADLVEDGKVLKEKVSKKENKKRLIEK